MSLKNCKQTCQGELLRPLLGCGHLWGPLFDLQPPSEAPSCSQQHQSLWLPTSSPHLAWPLLTSAGLAEAVSQLPSVDQFRGPCNWSSAPTECGSPSCSGLPCQGSQSPLLGVPSLHLLHGVLPPCPWWWSGTSVCFPEPGWGGKQAKSGRTQARHVLSYLGSTASQQHPVIELYYSIFLPTSYNVACLVVYSFPPQTNFSYGHFCSD